MKQYKILYHKTADELSKMVTDAMQKGFTPCGSLVVQYARDTTGDI